MIRRVPIVPTLIVLAAVTLMMSLGVWQLHRARGKEGLLARYAQAQKLRPIAWPNGPLAEGQLPLFRHATGVCLRPLGKRAIAGENVAGEPGYALIVECATGGNGPPMSVEVGWSKD